MSLPVPALAVILWGKRWMKGRGSHTVEGSEITKEESWVMLQLAGRWRRGKKWWGEETG